MPALRRRDDDDDDGAPSGLTPIQSALLFLCILGLVLSLFLAYHKYRQTSRSLSPAQRIKSIFDLRPSRPKKPKRHVSFDDTPSYITRPSSDSYEYYDEHGAGFDEHAGAMMDIDSKIQKPELVLGGFGSEKMGMGCDEKELGVSPSLEDKEQERQFSVLLPPTPAPNQTANTPSSLKRSSTTGGLPETTRERKDSSASTFSRLSTVMRQSTLRAAAAVALGGDVRSSWRRPSDPERYSSYYGFRRPSAGNNDWRRPSVANNRHSGISDIEEDQLGELPPVYDPKKAPPRYSRYKSLDTELQMACMEWERAQSPYCYDEDAKSDVWEGFSPVEKKKEKERASFE